MSSNLSNNSKGSVWHRWEPHIHTPGTILNNQFKGSDPWDDYLTRIENSSPGIRALGITDYCSIENYEKVVQKKKEGRLADVELIFPNIELRLLLGTARDSAINAHLLVSPEDQDHVKNTIRFLQDLEFSVGTQRFLCQKEDLIRLGKFHDKTITDDVKALEAGTNQFKVTFEHLETAFKNNDWAKNNIILAVSANTGDGTSGLNNDASFNTTRQYIERVSQIMFAGSEKQRKYWLGQGVDSVEKIVEKFNGCKPCIHGSDAHDNEAVGKPDMDRFTWIKGDLKFESLRQICIEPHDRVIVGASPPNNQISSNIIEDVTISNANWIDPPVIELNSGLVAIIGARGSGKTALADLIAVGGTAINSQLSNTSFVRRAEEYLTDVEVALKWQTGGSTSQTVGEIDFETLWDVPRVQYLSQQFVDRLCSSEGMTDELMEEIERVIFVSHPQDDRLGMADFQELLAERAAISRQERKNQEEIIEDSSSALNEERIKMHNLPGLEKKYNEKEALLQTDRKNRDALVTTGNAAKLAEFKNVSAALDKVGLALEQAQRKRQSFAELRQAVDKARSKAFPEYTQKLENTYTASGLTATQWKEFAVDFKGDVSKIIDDEIKNVDKVIGDLKGKPLGIKNYDGISLLPVGVDLDKVSFETLTQEAARIKHLIGIDSEKGKQYNRLSEKILKDETELGKLKKEIDNAKGAKDRSKTIQEERKQAYNEVFKAIIEEEKQLNELYLPLMKNLTGQKGSLSKLTFKVQRHANIAEWATAGEALLDLRKTGPFKGMGTLHKTANDELKKIWETGTADEISDAMAAFRKKHEQAILEHAQAERTDLAGFRNWLNQVSSWLYSTEHVTVSYSVQYDSVDIKQLSPGTRGIVLLLLYLAIDTEDDRPLIIDQPEENLDPKSIFDELVPLFREVKQRRQIIIVTHNANLVVNTDADQVIVASCGPHRANKLPEISYESGGLENPQIRNQVCAILEGGEQAFRERAKRLRVVV